MSESLTKDLISETVATLVARSGEPLRSRIEAGVGKCAALWRSDDGSPAEFQAFCLENFWSDASLRNHAFERLERNFEFLMGHLSALSRHLSAPQALTSFEPSPVDDAFAEYSPLAHLDDTLFANKVAFQVVLNFPAAALEKCLAEGSRWNRRQWAEQRLGCLFRSRVPARLSQESATVATRADHYIATYNIPIQNLRSSKGEAFFAHDRKLITHWGLRDEIRAQYAEGDAVGRQQALYEVMCRIISQSIPREAINGDKVLWNPTSNLVSTDGGASWKEGRAEDGERYEHLRRIFEVERRIDVYHPETPTRMDRAFLLSREISEKATRDLFETLLSSPLLKKTGARLSQLLGRPLLPFDIWFNRWSSQNEEETQASLDARVRSRFPHAEAFQQALPDILASLGFTRKTAQWLSERIEVDPSRGAGHAAPCTHRGDKAHLRTRFGTEGMDYKGFNIAIHELGHNVEQVFSMYGVDHYLLSGVPNTAFTEAFAFAFQCRDRQVLGLPLRHDAALGALQEYWQTCEIAAVALVDMDLWHWMYEHPEANARQIGAAAQQIAREVWNRFWAPAIGIADSPILAIYSHMISANLYLPDYPLGHIISYQIERHLRSHPLAEEMERMCRIGCLAPNAWMRAAVGEDLSVAPLLADVEKALGVECR